ncbi:transposase [Micromonospora trifolii]|uniref:transposase n=1 Tax=Micromonospora trifolii TaxID=2911208 RepID=UPI003D2EBA02
MNRRSIAAGAPELVPLHQLVTVAGRRWSIEESFRQVTKTGLGLDQHQHRRWKAWHRWTTLVIAAHAFLAAAATVSTTCPRRVADVIRLVHLPTSAPKPSQDQPLRPRALTEP